MRTELFAPSFSRLTWTLTDSKFAEIEKQKLFVLVVPFDMILR